MRKSVPNFKSSKSSNASYLFMNYSIISFCRQMVFSLQVQKWYTYILTRKQLIIFELLSAISVIIDYFERKLSHFSNQTSSRAIYEMVTRNSDLSYLFHGSIVLEVTYLQFYRIPRIYAINRKSCLCMVLFKGQFRIHSIICSQFTTAFKVNHSWSNQIFLMLR